MANILAFLFLLSLLGMVWGTIKPEHIAKVTRSKKVLPRKHIAVRFAVLAAILFILIGVVAPKTDKKYAPSLTSSTQKSQTQQIQSQPAKPKDTVETKQVRETSHIPFTTTIRDDATLPKGQTKVTQDGKDGVQTSIYAVTYTNGKETSRSLVSQTITTTAQDKIVANGTYVAPAPTAPSSGSGSGYVNSAGNYVPSPSSNPAGATAQCNDGTYSYSQTHSGTCSHHGGVARWL